VTEIERVPIEYDTTAVVINHVAKGVEKGGKIIVKGVEEGGKLLNKGVELGGSYIKSKTTPNETPTPVNPVLKGTVKVASSVSPYAVKITKGLATGLAIVAKEIGSVVANKIIENTSTGQKMSNTFNGPKTEAATNVGKKCSNWICKYLGFIRRCCKELVSSNTKEYC